MPGMSPSPSRSRGLVTSGMLAVLRRPVLAGEALRALIGIRGSRAARDAYYDWRSLTAHGDPHSPTTPEELTEFLRWRRRVRRIG